MELRQNTVEGQGLVITVREERGSDVFAELTIEKRLPPDPGGEEEIRAQFVSAVLRTVKIEGLPFRWVTLASGAAETQAAYEAWRGLRRNQLILWANALFDVNQSPGDADLGPVLPGES